MSVFPALLKVSPVVLVSSNCGVNCKIRKRERIFAAIRHVDAGVLDRVREYVDSGTSIEAPQMLRVPCAGRVVVEMPNFELGMDRTALVKNQRVMALKPGSAAERAGARNGDVVVGTGVYWNDVTKPVRLTIKAAKGSSTCR